jgi:chitin disaccharide deacetylase
VNEAIEQAHRNGILTAASLMVTGAAVADAVARACRLPTLRVGLHLVLVDGVPALPVHAVPDLVERSGIFRPNMVLAGINLAVSGRAQRQLAAEITAQFEAFRSTGLALDHANAHKHFHVHPVIGNLLLRIGRDFGLHSVRVPLEPADVLRRVEPASHLDRAWLLTTQARHLLQKVREFRLFAPDAVFGIRWSGAMTRDRLLGLLGALPAGTTEIYCHPALHGGFPGSAPAYRYADEFSALTDHQVLAAAQKTGIMLRAFSDFAAPNC